MVNDLTPSNPGLSVLAQYARLKADDDTEPPPDRRLWEQIAGEVDAYLHPDEAMTEAGLFEVEPW